MSTYVIQMKTKNTPGRYVLHGRFDSESHARQWANHERYPRDIIHAEIWNLIDGKFVHIETLY